jgi:hypothetical protein
MAAVTGNESEFQIRNSSCFNKYSVLQTCWAALIHQSPTAQLRAMERDSGGLRSRGDRVGDTHATGARRKVGREAGET